MGNQNAWRCVSFVLLNLKTSFAETDMSSISTLNQGTGQLRIKMQGINFAHRLELPQLELVLRDAAKG